MYQKRGLFVQSLFLIWLGLACRFVSAQSVSCPSITINDLGNTTEFSSNGLVSVGIVPPGESFNSIPVKIINFTIVCDTSGNRTNTSSFVSVVVEFQCNFTSAISSLAICSDPNSTVTRQYQFECIERGGQPVWEASVSGSGSNVQTINPTATLSTPLVNQCRRCIDDVQSSRADPTTHCDPCPPRCDRGQRRCYLGQAEDVCCNFYLQGGCVTDCPSALVADSNFDCVCSSLSIENGDVSYTPANRGIRSVATYTCNSGYRLSSPQDGDTRTCSESGWSDQNFTCEQIQCPELSIKNGQVIITPIDRTVNSTAVYTCNGGYKLDKGDATRTCQDEGTWSGQTPECLIIQCPELSIENGKVIVTHTERTVNSTAEYTCDNGYELDKGDAKRTCRNGGAWSGQTPECSKEGLSTGAIVGIAIAIGVVAGIIIVVLIIAVIALVKSSKNKTVTQPEKNDQLPEKMVDNKLKEQPD